MKKGKDFNKDDYLIIPKNKIEDIIIFAVLVIFVVFTGYLMIRGALNMSAEMKLEGADINSEKVSSFADEDLNIVYPVPGDTWMLADVGESSTTIEAPEVDSSELEDINFNDETTDTEDSEAETENSTDITSIEKFINNASKAEIAQASSGEDSVFDIQADALLGEVLSSMYFNQQGVEGYAQFMSFTFKPDIGYDEGTFEDYCKASLERDATLVNEGVEVSDFNLLSSQVDDEDSIMLKCTVLTKVLGEDGVTYEDYKLYYTQYVKRIGVNLLTITFGSINEDNTVDKYLKYFANNVVNVNTLVE